MGVLISILACPAPPPDLEEALYLYREGHINEARKDMGAYLRAKPYNPESEEARQHIILIRRIKQLESIAIEQWYRGNHQGAAKIVGIMRILHPVYIDSTDIYRIIDFSQPPQWISAPSFMPEAAPFDTSDEAVQRIIPFAQAFLDYQQETIAHLVKQWEVGKYADAEDPLRYLVASLTEPEAEALLGAVDSAYQELHQIVIKPDQLIMELDLLAEQFNQFLAFIRADTLPQILSFEYSFQSHKRDILLQILTLKSRLASIPVPTEAADSSSGNIEALPSS
jgi:hypothetical protein